MEETEKNKCNFCNKIFSSRQSKCNHVAKFHKNLCIPIINENKISCTYCNKYFSTKSSLTRHIKYYCKTKNDFINKVINEKSKDKTNKINITINNINYNNKNVQNNQTNNILSINPYNNPNINQIKLIDICNIFDEEFNMILKLIEITYFNDKIEENHSFYISNLQGEYVNTFNNEETCNTKLKKYFFDELFTMILTRIKSLYSKYKNTLFEIPKQVEIQEKIQALEDMKKENNHTYKSYLKLINVLAYDKKDIVINTWTKLKQLESVDQNKDDDIIWDRNIDLKSLKI
jgi:hypothetical protein